MLTTPKMLETRTKATSTSHQTPTLPQAPHAKTQVRTSIATHPEETDTIFIIITNVNSNKLFFYSTVLCCIPS